MWNVLTVLYLHFTSRRTFVWMVPENSYIVLSCWNCRVGIPAMAYTSNRGGDSSPYYSMAIDQPVVYEGNVAHDRTQCSSYIPFTSSIYEEPNSPWGPTVTLLHVRWSLHCTVAAYLYRPNYSFFALSTVAIFSLFVLSTNHIYINLHYWPYETQLSFLSYRAHAPCANTLFQLNMRAWPSWHSDLCRSTHGWGLLLEQTGLLSRPR